MEKTEKVENSDELAPIGAESELAEKEPTPQQVDTVVLQVQNGYIGTTAKRI